MLVFNLKVEDFKITKFPQYVAEILNNILHQ